MTGLNEGDALVGRNCPRCRHDNVEVMAKSPVGQVWEVYICLKCQYSWRSTEPQELQNPDKYSSKFSLSNKDIENLASVIPLPSERM